MPLDHYISQVHLKNWLSPQLRRQLYVIRKSDLTSFTSNAKNICGINAGNTNRYLPDKRQVEKFLEEIEPEYNQAIEKLINNKIDKECIYTVAGFISYVSVCSPTSMRLHSPALKKLVASTAVILDKKEQLPKLRGVKLSQLLQNGTAEIRLDNKYTQASGIIIVPRAITQLGNCEWEIICNDHHDSSFFTSDYPIALEVSKEYPDYNNKIVPLTPNVAIRIKPDPSTKGKDKDQAFSSFRYRKISASYDQVRYINRLIVRSAEDLIIYRDDKSWVKPLVEKNRDYRIELVQLPDGRLRQKIVKIESGVTKEAEPEGNHWFEFAPANLA